jgi:hypothetical protein
LKSALFVDFDNVYSGLRKLDLSIADCFARTPQRWMSWLVDSLELPQPAADGERRRILVRRCYLNPQVYQRFRPAFNLAGFEIIDCPSLTSEGKTSTDIHMVLDMIDLLLQETRYDEFIVFSADADFTPVLRKLRRWDRRTTVLAIGFPSAAYRASADLLIDQDGFVREALGFHDEDDSMGAEPTSALASKPHDRDLGSAALVLLKKTIADATAPVALAKIASTILSTVDGMDASTWAGYGSFRRLVESWNLAPLQVSWDGGGFIRDPRRHSAPTSVPVSAPKTIDEVSIIIDLIRTEIAEASLPVPCSQIASLITAQHAGIANDWNGMGSFRKFVESMDLSPMRVDWNSSGGHLYDPRRHTLMTESAAKINGNQVGRADWGNDRDLLPIASQIHDVTGAPLLSPSNYQTLFHLIGTDLATHAFDLKETGKRVRDATRASGQLVSRSDVGWILRGLLLGGHAFGSGEDDARTLSRKTIENLRSLCLREQMVIDQGIDQALERWINRGA